MARRTVTTAASGSSRTPRGVARPPRSVPFNPPANSPAAFLAELKSFAARHPRTDPGELSALLPLSFSGDASLLLDGKRRVVSADSTFEFGCTGCGSCCRTYPNDVMLDPHDLFLMSRSQEAGVDSTTALHKAYPKAFQRALGIWEAGEHIVPDGGGGRSSAGLGSVHKLAPVLFLRTKKVKVVSKNGGASKVEERCWFSYPAAKYPVELVAEEARTDDNNSGEIKRAQAPQRKDSPAAASASLRCQLGSKHQPTACALYPLGELYSDRGGGAPLDSTATASASDPAAAAEPARAVYYTLDTTNCEGTRAVPSPTTSTSVRAYAQRNELPARRAEWEWFSRRIAEPLAAAGWMSLAEPSPRRPLRGSSASSGNHPNTAGLDESFRDKLGQVVYDVWFDFDSLECAPAASAPSSSPTASSSAVAASARRFTDWNTARVMIEAATSCIADSTKQYVAECSADPASQPQAEERWMARLRERGFVKRTK